MALTAIYLFLLLIFFGITSSCNVTCSTDFDVLLNCSFVAGSMPTQPVLLDVQCSDGETDVLDSCLVKPPQSWCVMYPPRLYEVAFIGTMCTATISQQGGQVKMLSSSWPLSDVVKPPPPVNVHVTNTDGLYNITWDTENKKDCLTYRVRIRVSNHLSMDPIYSIFVDEKFTVLDHKNLSPRANFSVDIQAKMCPQNLYQGPWSEWSSTAEWTTSWTSSEIEEANRCWLYILLSIVLVIGLLFVFSLQKTSFLQKRIRLYTYVSRPDDFFKPLYHNYDGNFKEWVKPVFSEYDHFTINAQVEMFSEKHLDVFPWNDSKRRYSKDDKMKQGVCSLLQPECNPLLHVQDGGSWQCTAGHISIHTVTLSGEEEFDEDVESQSSFHRSYHDGESLRSYNKEKASYDLEELQASSLDGQHENPIFDDQNINLPEHDHASGSENISLDSFASNGQSEDGYPHVDLDTIDSGFGECSSPAASDSSPVNLSELPHEHSHLNSNYVKQWMISSTIKEDPSNSTNSQIQ